MNRDKLKLNSVMMTMQSKAVNVALARSMVAALASQCDAVTVNALEELKVAVSEAVSNAIIHGYENQEDKQLTLRADLLEDGILIAVEDEGVGIANIAQAMEPSYSQDPERMGLGFAFMQSFTDRLEVESAPGRGTTVRMFKYFCQGDQKNACQA